MPNVSTCPWCVLNPVHVSEYRFIIIFFFSELEIAYKLASLQEFCCHDRLSFSKKSTFLASAAL